MRKQPTSLPPTNNRQKLERPRAAWGLRAAYSCAFLAAFGFGLLAVRAGAQDTGRKAPESAGPEFRSATEDEQIELLRKLLGVAAPPPPVPDTVVAPEAAVDTPAAPEPALSPEPPTTKPAPKAVTKPTPKPAPKPVAKPSPKQTKPAPKVAPPKPPVAKPTPKVQPKPAAKPARKPAPKPAPKPVRRAPVAPKARPKPAPVAAPESEAPDAVDGELLEAEVPAPRFDPALQISATDVPEAGTIITSANVDRWYHLLTPSLRWAIDRGMPMHVIEPKPIIMEPARIEATEQYHAQVRLAEDKRGIENYIAGIPFPEVTAEDPDAAVKLMYNFENRLAIDDVNGLNFGCKTGQIDPVTGVRVERDYRVGNFRRLFHVGRLYVEPKPVWPTPGNIRYREAVYPILEPFDFKGAGFTTTRYQDAARSDDSWLYFPQTRRVRRLSTTQRSEGVFGIDVDLDSYAGFAGNPAWFEWRLLGKKTLLAPYHAKHEPIKWADKPADFIFDDQWEPRETYILSARSLIPGYNFSLRIIYVDAQSFYIPYTEVYDHDGQLWRAYVHQWKCGLKKAMPTATEAVYDVPTNFIQALTVFDMQEEHATFCEFPASDLGEKDMWYYWRGEDGGSTPEDFDVSMMIQSGR